MNNHLQKDVDNSSNEAPASIPQTTPKGIGYGHPEFQFIQSIMEMQKSLGEINASIQALNKTVDSTKSKVDELVKWKHMIVQQDHKACNRFNLTNLNKNDRVVNFNFGAVVD